MDRQTSVKLNKIVKMYQEVVLARLLQNNQVPSAILELKFSNLTFPSGKLS